MCRPEAYYRCLTYRISDELSGGSKCRSAGDQQMEDSAMQIKQAEENTDWHWRPSFKYFEVDTLICILQFRIVIKSEIWKKPRILQKIFPCSCAKNQTNLKALHNSGRSFNCCMKLYLGSWENWQVCFESFAVLQNSYSHSLFSLEQLVHFGHYTLFLLVFLSDCKEIVTSIISRLRCSNV